MIGRWGFGAAVCLLACGVARGHEAELIIGRTAGNQLKIHFDAKLPVDMPVSVFPGFPGWAAFEQGFESTALDEPDEDFYQLDPMSDIEFVLVSQDEGIRISSDSGGGFVPVGGTFHFGQPFFDFHPIWNIFDGQQMDPNGGALALETAAFAAVNNGYVASNVSVFTPHPINASQEFLVVSPPMQAPEIDPASLASGLTLLLGGLAVAGGRRRILG